MGTVLRAELRMSMWCHTDASGEPVEVWVSRMMAVAKEMRRKMEDGSEAWWVQRAPREWAERLRAVSS